MEVRILDLRRHDWRRATVENGEVRPPKTFHGEGWPRFLLHPRPVAVDRAGHLGLQSLHAARLNFARIVGRAKYPLKSRPVNFVGISGLLAEIYPDPVRLGSLEHHRTAARDGAAAAALGVVDMDRWPGGVRPPARTTAGRFRSCPRSWPCPATICSRSISSRSGWDPAAW